jgi:serine/threonine protein kinase
MQPGQLLCDRYRIEKALAAGGFGQTFLAVNTDLPSKPQVVVKLLKPQSNDPATLQVAKRLFNQEAEILERLGKDNPRIPSLHAYFELKDEFYLVQEYIKGKTLTEELKGRKLSESDTIAMSVSELSVSSRGLPSPLPFLLFTLLSFFTATKMICTSLPLVDYRKLLPNIQILPFKLRTGTKSLTLQLGKI